MKITTNQHKIITKIPDTLNVFGDRDRIGQVLINLIGNAIKYSPNGGTIYTRLKKVNGFAEVVIQDFGVGIDKKNQTKIFERFYQVDEPENPAFSGLGVGLYIANEIVRRHDGKITLKSERGKGSFFKVYLPIEGKK